MTIRKKANARRREHDLTLLQPLGNRVVAARSKKFVDTQRLGVDVLVVSEPGEEGRDEGLSLKNPSPVTYLAAFSKQRT